MISTTLTTTSSLEHLLASSSSSGYSGGWCFHKWFGNVSSSPRTFYHLAKRSCLSQGKRQVLEGKSESQIIGVNKSFFSSSGVERRRKQSASVAFAAKRRYSARMKGDDGEDWDSVGQSDELRRLRQKEQALHEAMDAINREMGLGTIVNLKNHDFKLKENFSSGCLTLDLAIGGGLPRGRIIEIFGPESSGKTTLALHAIAEMQKLGEYALLVDTEHAFDPEHARRIGVNLNRLMLCQSVCAEQALEVVDKVVRSNAVGIAVVDSVAALVPQAEISGEIGQPQPGLQARIMSMALRKLAGNADRARCSILFVNQLRQKLNMGYSFGPSEVTTGGMALKFYASLRLETRMVSKIPKTGEETVGIRVRARVAKSKVSTPHRKAEFDILFGSGISKLGCIVECGEAVGLITRRGAWYSWGEESLGQGREKVVQYLQDNPHRCTALEMEVRDKFMEVAMVGSEALEQLQTVEDETGSTDSEVEEWDLVERD